MIEMVLLVFIISSIKKLKVKEALKDWSVILVLSTAMIYVILQIMIFANNYSLFMYTGMVKIFTFICYFIMAYKNKLYKYIIVSAVLVLIGSALNEIVKHVNNGYMPIFPSLTYSTGYTDIEAIGANGDHHILGNQNTNMIWLADIFDWGYCIASIGDIVIRTGMGFLLYKTIKHKGTQI